MSPHFSAARKSATEHFFGLLPRRGQRSEGRLSKLALWSVKTSGLALIAGEARHALKVMRVRKQIERLEVSEAIPVL